MGKTVAIIQARIGGTRLPGKVLSILQGQTLLARHVRRMQRVASLDAIVVAIPTGKANDLVAEEAKRLDALVVRGSENDVLARYHAAAKKHKADVVVRTTADCPFIDPGVVSGAVKEFASGEYDYLSNNLERTFPHGLDVEVFSAAALAEANRQSKHPFEREHVTEWIRRHQDRPYRLGNLRYPIEGVPRHASDCKSICTGPHLATILREARLTVDYPEDLLVVGAILDFWESQTRFITTADILWLLHRVPEIMELNRGRAAEHAQLLAGAYEPISEEGRAEISEMTKEAMGKH